PAGDASTASRLHEEIESDLASDTPADSSPPSDLTADARIAWLATLLSAAEPAKVLVLCHSADKAQAIKAALERHINVTTALFHEELTLVQRDRNAAWFAEPAGARLLVCSELGSEGRNFQHAQHLVMFDLPLDPDLVEQRIGRLDRIGQRGLVHIHVPAVAGSGMEVLARWHDEGVDSFRRPTLTAPALLERFGERVRKLALRAGAVQTPAGGTRAEEIDRDLRLLVTETADAARELAARVEDGRDRLLEMASLRRDVAGVLVDGVRARDEDEELDDYLLRLLEHFGVYAEELGERVYLLNPDGSACEDFPSLERGETAVTFDRAVALVREDLEFMTCDHPLLGDAMELLLASQSGNAVFAVMDGNGGPPRLFLEAVFVLESVAPPRLHVDRFLAPTPIRVVVDQHLAELECIPLRKGAALGAGRGRWLVEKQSVLGPALAKMAARCEKLAEIRADELRAEARAAMARRLGDEIERLRALAAINDHIRADEERAMQAELEELAVAIDAARLRPDALRLLWQGPSRDGVPITAR
ncbi:MAG: RNA polymerase-binding ATPase, partial [Deltaproteobacteria bacterium]|nr:RNA polymerase-binding ATPase [Deltaproteobacteria bacterium]